MFEKKWTNVVLLDSFKDATLIGRAEELGGINYNRQLTKKRADRFERIP